MQKRLGITALIAVLTIVCAPALGSREPRQPQWSEDLSAYGYSERHPYSASAIAASEDNVAVALNLSQDVTATPIMPATLLNSKWKLSLLVFDATNGKLRAACGPWFGSVLFNLWSTSNGNFLLYQEAQRVVGEKTRGRVVLLSPSCQVLAKVDLPVLEKAPSTEFLISPTLRTFVITETSGHGPQCEVRDADTLLERFKIGTTSDDSRVVAVSDNGLLGVKPSESLSSTRAPAKLFYFDFHAQKWTEIPGSNASYTPGSVSFVSNGAFIETETMGGTDAWSASGTRIIVRTMDGTVAFSTTISSKNNHMEPGSNFVVSPTGNYFGVVLSSYSVARFWHFLDMSPGHEDAYIWSLRSAQPIARISIRSGSQHQQLAFAPDDSWFAFRDGKMIIVRRLPHRDF